MEELRVLRLRPTAHLPARATPYAAGYDLKAEVGVEIPPGGRVLVPTGLAIAVPPGTYGRIAPRSGLAWKHGLDVGAGVIDADYRGELKVLLFNLGLRSASLAAGERVAQLVLERVATPPVLEVSALEETARGAGGFGSTGK